MLHSRLVPHTFHTHVRACAHAHAHTQFQHYAASWTTLCHFLTTCSESWLSSKWAIPSLCTTQSINRSVCVYVSQSSLSASIHLQRICALHIQGRKFVSALECLNVLGFTKAKASIQISNNALHPWKQFYYWICFNFTDKRRYLAHINLSIYNIY
jgi:hypothetical protein